MTSKTETNQKAIDIRYLRERQVDIPLGRGEVGYCICNAKYHARLTAKRADLDSTAAKLKLTQVVSVITEHPLAVFGGRSKCCQGHALKIHSHARVNCESVSCM